jgi:hypothetical protein
MLRSLQAHELYEGCSTVRFGLPLRLGWTKQGLIETLWCRLRKRRLRLPSTREESGRNPGPSPCPHALEERNPGEHPAINPLNTGLIARDSRKEQSPETEVVSPYAIAFGPSWAATNGMWVLPAGNRQMPFARRTLRRVNPMSAAGAKQNRQGVEGSKASRG